MDINRLRFVTWLCKGKKEYNYIEFCYISENRKKGFASKRVVDWSFQWGQSTGIVVKARRILQVWRSNVEGMVAHVSVNRPWPWSRAASCPVHFAKDLRLRTAIRSPYHLPYQLLLTLFPFPFSLDLFHYRPRWLGYSNTRSL